MTPHFHLHSSRLLIGAVLCLGLVLNSFAQVQPITGLSAAYDNLSDTSDDYSTPGSGAGAYPSGTQYDMKFNVGEQNNLAIQGFEVGTNVYDFIQLAQKINIVRVDNPTVTGTHNIVFFETETVSGTNLHLKPSLVTTMVDSLRSDLANRGADNVFANEGNSAGNNNNIERIDYIFNAGFPYYNFTDQRGFLVMDRGGNDRFKIAVVLAVDSNDMPTLFSDPVTVLDSEWGSSGISLETLVMRGYTEGGDDLKPSAFTSTQPLSGVFLSWDQFNLTTNDMVFGYSLAGNDVTTDGAYWTQVTNATYFPTNTTVASDGGGLDLISGGAMFFDQVLEVAIGDYIWEDYNGDGVQDAVEPGLSNTLVYIYTSSNVLAATARSDSNGWYFAQGLGAGDFYLQFFPPDGYTISPQYVSHDSTLDSDPDALTGITETFTLGSGDTNLTIDAGLYLTPGDLTLTKTVSSTNLNVGDEMVFTLSVTNRGLPNTDRIQITDALPSAFNFSGYGATTGTFNDVTGIWDIGWLATNAWGSISITGTVNAGSGGSTITNTALITRMNRPDTNETDNTASAVFTVQSADLGVTKVASTNAIEEGFDVTFTLSVTNFGPHGVTDVEVDDLLPSGFVYSNSTPSQGSYDDGTGVWDVGALTNGGGATLELIATAEVGSGGTILTNVASIGNSSHEDPTSSNDEAEVPVLIYGADLAIAKSVDPLAAIVGQSVLYTIVITNPGPTNATGVLVSEPLTNGLTYVSDVASQGSYDDAAGVWDVGSLTLYSSATLRITATVDAGTMDTVITNLSRITDTDWPDPDSSNDEDTATLSVSSLELTKASDVSLSAHPGDTIVYTIVASNAGGQTHADVTLLDSIPDGTAYVADSLSVTRTPPASTTVVYTASTIFMAPPSVTSVTVQAWGGGGGGGRARADPSTAGGGAGGAYAIVVMAVTPLQNYTVTVGLGGIGGNSTGEDTQHGRPGNPSWFGTTNTVFAEGGARGLSDERNKNVNGAPGLGSSALSVGDTVYRGGDGSYGVCGASGYGGSGGGGAGTTGAGGDASAGTGGSGTSLYGGDGADGPGPSAVGLDGSAYGGGGSGGDADDRTDRNGGAGADGAILISYEGGGGDDNDPPDIASSWTLSPGQKLEAIFSVLVDDPLDVMGITNTVTASSDLQPIPVSATVIDPVTHTDLAITKTASVSSLEETESLVYTVTVTNLSLQDAASGVEVEDLIPAGFEFDDATASQGSYDTNTGVWVVGAIDTNGYATLELDVTAVTNGGGFYWTNTASITAYDQFDPNLTNNTDQAIVLIKGADLVVSKTVDNPTPNETSQILYTIQVSNAGPSDITGVVIYEPLTNGLTYVSNSVTQGSYVSGTGLWSLGALNVGSSATLRVAATVDVGTFGTVITNRSLVSAADLPDPASGNNEDTATIIISGLNVTKTSDVSGYASPGDTITYSILVTNVSGVAHTGIDLSDVLPTGTVYVADTTWITGPGVISEAGDAPVLIATNRSLAAGEALTVTFDALVINPGSSTQLLNTVSVTCDQQPAPVTAWVADMVLHTDLGLSKTVDDEHPDEGDTVVYTLIVTNSGPTNATGISVYEALTNGLTYVSHGAGQGTYTNATGTWNIGELLQGASAQLVITATVDAATSGSFITNRASISGADMADLIPANNSDTSVIQVVSVDIGIGKSGNPAIPVESGLLIYTISVTNLGPDTATGIEVTDLLPGPIDYFSYTAGQGTYDSTTGVWSVGTLDSMQSTTLDISTVVQTNTLGTSITNTATVSDVDQVDSDPGNETASVVVSPAEALLDLDKTVDTAGPVWPGDVLTYTLAVTNRSGVTQTNVTLTDPLPTGAVYVVDSCWVTAPVTVEETFGDLFGFRIYGNNDGTETWASDWVEGEDNGPTAGSVQIQFDNGVDETYTLRFTSGSQTILREADLFAYRTATVEFEYQRIGLEVDEYVALEISSTGQSGPWTELDRFEGAATDDDYIQYTNDITAHISTNTVIRFISPAGMDSTDIFWIDDLYITGTRRANQTTAGGAPPDLTSGNLLEPDEAMSVEFQVWVENPALYSQIVNQGSLTSDQMTSPQVDTAVTDVETCSTVQPTGLYANPTNVYFFTAHWDEVLGSFGYQLDVSTSPTFDVSDYVAGYSNRAIASTEQSVTGLTYNTIYYFRVRAEWSPLCVSSNSETASVTTLDLPSIWSGPEFIDFGIVNVGDSSNLTVVITNSSAVAIDITAIAFTGSGTPTNFSVLPATSSIPSSNSITLTITFTPTANETNDLTMTIYNTSIDYPELEVGVTGIGYDPDTLSPELLAYLIDDSASLTNEVTDRSLGEGTAAAEFTVYHATGMTMAGASFDLLYSDDTIALSNASFSSIEAETLDGKACQKLSATIPRIFPALLGDYSARITVSSSNGLWLVDEAEFTAVSAGDAVPELLDDFFRSNVSDDIGEGWLSSVTGPVSGNIQILNRVLQLYGPGGTGGTNGRVAIARDLSSRYSSILTNNTGTLTWAFNFFSAQDPKLGIAPGGYAAVFVLGSDSTDWGTGSGNGYAVRICSNEVALTRFSGGLNLDSDLTTLGSVASLSSPTSSLAIQVDLDPDTGVWTLYVNELGGSGVAFFGNPLEGMAGHEVMQVTNTFHLHRSLPYVGCYWNHGNASVDSTTAAFLDDFYAPYVMPATEPMEFGSIDNDIMFPSAIGGVLVNGEVVPEEVPDRLDVVWTNSAEFIITFDPLSNDQDPGYAIPTVQRDVRGIGEYRVSSASVDALTPSNRALLGLPFPVVSTNGALANYGFEIIPSGGDWILDANCQIQSRSDDASKVYEGTNSLFQTASGSASQTFEFRNEAGVTPRVSLSGYFLGEGISGMTIDAFATNDLVNPVATASVWPDAETNWTLVSIAEQDLGDSTVEILKVTLSSTGYDNYWDQLRFTVDIGTNRPSLRFSPGADNQGLFPQYLFAVDADYNRVGDRLGGSTKFFYTPFDLTPPTPIQMAVGGTGASTETVDDPTTQFDLQWSTNGLGPDDPDHPLHPTKVATDIAIMSTWHSYRIYYGTFNPMNVPVDDEPTTTNGYIYTTFVENDAFRSWDYVDPATTIQDPSAPGYQSDYSALTNMGSSSIRLYDLDYDEDYVVVLVGIDKAGNVGKGGLQSWATNNTIRFALIRGSVVDKDVAQAAFPGANLNNTNTTTAGALYWIASGPTNEQGIYTNVSKDYDLISWDSTRFQESSNNQWQLVDTVRSNWFVDDGGQMMPRGYMRFYRASYKDRWRPTNYLGEAQQKLASEEIYAMHSVILSPGPNFVALHGKAYTNTFMGVFGGVDAFPGGPSALPDSGSTLVEFYTPGIDAVSSEQYYLSDQNKWMEVGGSEVTDVLQETNFFGRGFSLTLPDPLPEAYITTTARDENQDLDLDAMVWTPILQVPTNAFQQIIQNGSREGRVTVPMYNLVGMNLPVCAHPSEMRLLESGFVNGLKTASDQIYTINTSTKTVRSGSTIYCDTAGTWRFMSSDGLVPGGFFAPNDVLVIVSKNGGTNNTWAWTYAPGHFYDLPTRNMIP